MATLIELRNFANDSIFRNKIDTCVALGVHAVLSGADGVPPFSQAVDAHDTRVIWANAALGRINTQTDSFIEMVLSKNSSVSAANIQAAIISVDESDVDPIKDFVFECIDLVAGV